MGLLFCEDLLMPHFQLTSPKTGVLFEYTLLRADGEQASTVETKRRESGENAPFLPFKNAIEQRANNGKTSLYFTALKAATKPRESHVIAR